MFMGWHLTLFCSMSSCWVRSRSLAWSLRPIFRISGANSPASSSNHSSHGQAFNQPRCQTISQLTNSASVLGCYKHTQRTISKSHTPLTECQQQLCLVPHDKMKSEILQFAGFHSSSRHEEQTKALTVWQSMRELPRSPLPALTLGLSGLIPFVSAPFYMIMSGNFCPTIAYAQVAYGASILSFLGGVRWGFTLPEDSPLQPDWTNLGYSVLPSLVAWVGLLVPHPWSLVTVMGGLGAAAYSDLAVWGYPAWFKGLRFLLSLVAILALWTTCMCAMMLTGQSRSPDSEVAAPVPKKTEAPSETKEVKEHKSE